MEGQDRSEGPLVVTDEELLGFIERASGHGLAGCDSLKRIMRHLLNEAYRAGREDEAGEREGDYSRGFAVGRRAAREDAARGIVEHADRHAPRNGNVEQRRMRRHLMIAVQVASPKATLEEIAEAVRRGDFVACHLDDAGQSINLGRSPGHDGDNP